MTLKEMRELLELTQSQFSEKYKIPIRTLQGWELESRTPPAYVLHLLERCVLADAKAEGKYVDWAEVIEENEDNIKDALRKYAKMDLESNSCLQVFIKSDGEIFYEEYIDNNSWCEHSEPVFHLKTFYTQYVDVLTDLCDDGEGFDMVMQYYMSDDDKNKFTSICDEEEVEPNASALYIIRDNFPEAYKKAEELMIDCITGDMDFDAEYTEILRRACEDDI